MYVLILGLVYADLMSLPVMDRPYQRYIYLSQPTPQRYQITTLALNYTSSSPTIKRPTPVANGSLIRVDLRLYNPILSDLIRYTNTWEEYRFDPYFSTLITKDTIDLLKEERLAVASRKRKVGPVQPQLDKFGVDLNIFELVPCPPYQHEGSTFTQRYQRKTILELPDEIISLPVTSIILETKDDVVPIPVVDLLELQQITNSLAPIVEYNYFLLRHLSTIQDEGIYKTIYGGLYYEFSGLKFAKATDKFTDEDLLFEQLGVGSTVHGLTADKIFDQLRTDQRGAQFRSGVTGKWRRWDIFPTLIRNGLISVTHDIRDQDIDIKNQPIMNLLKLKDFAREVIYTKPNGLNAWDLFNKDGKRQREVPPDVAVNRLIPSPHSPRLQAGFGCISCHEATGDAGWKPLSNDVLTLLKGKVGVFDDLTGKDPEDTRDRIAGLYLASPDKLLRRAREDYGDQVLRATGPWTLPGANPAQLDIIKSVTTAMISDYHSHRYDLITGKTALADIGLIVKDEDAAKQVLETLLLPDKNAYIYGIVLEDPRIAALKAGIGLNRVDWDLIRTYVHSRIGK